MSLAMKRGTSVSGDAMTLRPIEIRPRRTPSQMRSRDTVGAILTAAARVFASRGYAGANTNLIAERAGVSVGSLYEYFSNKDAILVALTQAHLDHVRGIFREIAADLARSPGNVESAVRRFVTAVVAVHAADPRLHRILFEEAPRSRRMQQKLLAVEAELVTWTAQYLRSQNEIAIRDPALAAHMLVETIEGVTHKVVIHGDGRMPIDTYVGEIVALVMGYLRSRCGAS